MMFLYVINAKDITAIKIIKILYIIIPFILKCVFTSVYLAFYVHVIVLIIIFYEFMITHCIFIMINCK